jgi:uncharacterized phage-associated protein
MNWSPCAINVAIWHIPCWEFSAKVVLFFVEYLMITFQFKPEKFVNAAVFFVAQCPDTTKKKVCKLLYYADKEHLLRYGRTITGDSYYRLPHGPIPTYSLDLLRGTGGKANQAMASSFFEVKGWAVKAKRTHDPATFSKSELRILEEVCRKYGSLSADYLEKLSHREAAWLKTKPKERIDFALFFEGRPHLPDFLYHDE